MTTTLVAPTELRPVANAKPFDAWKRKGEDLFRRYQETRDAHETSQWDIGDWLVKGENNFGDTKAYETAEQITGWARGTLYNVVMVVRRFSDPSLRSETKLKWSHFKELARIPDEHKEIREQLLDELTDNFGCTVQDVRERVDAAMDKLADGKRTKKKKEHTQRKFVIVEVPLPRKFRNDIRSLAEARDNAVTELLQEILEEYFNRKQIKNELEKYLQRKQIEQNTHKVKAASKR